MITQQLFDIIFKFFLTLENFFSNYPEPLQDLIVDPCLRLLYIIFILYRTVLILYTIIIN